MSAKSAFNRTHHKSFATHLALFAMMFGTAGIASAQTNTNWLGGVSNWNNAANWSGGFVPNNGNGGQNWNVFIDNGLVGNAVVAFDLSSTVNQVNISTGDTLNILDNRTLGIAQSISNDGFINLLAAGNTTQMSFSPSSTINGTGVIALSGSTARIIGSGTLTQGAGHTIQGNGSIGVNTMFISNQGIFLANAAGDNLIIDVANAGGGVAAFTNDGFVRASGGGIVTLTGSGAGEFHGGGVYEAHAGSRINLIQDVILANTTISTMGNGTIRSVSGHAASLANVTNLGSLVREDNGSLTISGSFVNSGNVSVAAAGNVTDLVFNGPVNVTGNGTMSMSGVGARLRGSGTVTQAAGHTIQGNGNAGTNTILINNQGLFLANGGDNLTIDVANAGGGVAAFTNDGFVRASAGGIVTLTGSGAGEFHGSGTYEALAGSQIRLIQDAVLASTTLSTGGNGTILVLSGHNASLVNVTNLGNIVRDDNGTLGIGGPFVNSGNVSVVGAGNTTQIFVSGAVNLSGAGSINMSGTGARIAGAGGGSILTNVDNTISGSGNAGANVVMMINQATFQAGAGESLTIDPLNAGGGIAAFANSGIVRATGGGVVTLTGSGAGEFHGAPGGLFEAQASSRMDLVSDVVVRNATLSTVGDGLIRLVAGHNAAWDGVTNTGNFRKDDNGTLTLVNNLTNSGNMQFVGAGNFTQMFVSGSVNLGGGGTVNLSGTGARIIGAGGGSNLTNVDNTISGTGNVGANSMAVINQGTIQAGAGESLTIDPLNAGAGNSTFTNDGVVRATGGGTVILTGSGAGEFSGNGTFEALNGSNVLFDGSAIVQNISGGTLNSGTWRAIDGGAGASVRVQNNATSQINTIGANAAVELSGANSQFTVQSTNIAIDTTLSTVNGTLILRDGRDMTLSGGLTNNGSLQVDGAASSLNVTAGFQQNSGSTTLTNGGVLALNGASNNIDGGTLEGIGNVIGDLTFGSAATLNPGFSPGQLDFTGDLTWDDGGLVFFDLGTNAPTSDFLAVSGNLIKGINGTFAFTFLNNNWVAGQTYDLMSFASTSFSASDFSFTNGVGFTGTFAITGGNLLQFNLISAVPEPGVISVLLLAGIAGSSMVRRRRKRHN